MRKSRGMISCQIKENLYVFLISLDYKFFYLTNEIISDKYFIWGMVSLNLINK
jgi:hypothetical protein